jgi:hypothetical protein
MEDLEETRNVWKLIKAESTKTLKKLEDSTKLKMVNTSEMKVKQIDVEVNVGNKTINAIIDCGADVDYANEKWCKDQRFPIHNIGEGWMEGYDGKKTKVQLQEVEIEFQFLGLTQRQRFRVIKKTGTDLLVLGMPWLQKINPDVDWKKRTVNLREDSASTRRGQETPTSRRKDVTSGNRENSLDNSKGKKIINNEMDPTQGRRGGYGGDATNKRIEYLKRLQETKDKLPKEIKDYAEVFCQEE